MTNIIEGLRQVLDCIAATYDKRCGAEILKALPDTAPQAVHESARTKADRSGPGTLCCAFYFCASSCSLLLSRPEFTRLSFAKRWKRLCRIRYISSAREALHLQALSTRSHASKRQQHGSRTHKKEKTSWGMRHLQKEEECVVMICQKQAMFLIV